MQETTTIPERQAAPAVPAGEVAIRVEGLGKRYRLYDDPWGRTVEWATRGRVRRHTDFWALRGVSFEVARGECLGIIGANGAGKSTLLKILTGALHASEGRYDVRGRVLSLIELGTGMNQDLTGRQNIFHIARLLAFPPGYAKSRIDDIESFADIGAFFDRPVRLYSSGMRARLGFSMFAHMSPDVFIVDEVLSVGDVFFKQKCATRLKEMLDEGMTMLFVSHDTGAVENLCTQGLLLKEGTPAFLGSPEEAIALYHADLRAPKGNKWKREEPEEASAASGPADADEATAIVEADVVRGARGQRTGTGHATIRAIRVTNPGGRDTLRAPVGGRLVFHMLLEAHEDVARPTAGILLYDRFNTLVYGGGTNTIGHELPSMRAGQRMIVSLDATLSIRAGHYSFHAGVSEPLGSDPNAAARHDLITGLGPIHLHLADDAARRFFGQAEIPLRATHALMG